MAMSTTVMEIPSPEFEAGQGDAPRRGRARMCARPLGGNGRGFNRASPAPFNRCSKPSRAGSATGAPPSVRRSPAPAAKRADAAEAAGRAPRPGRGARGACSGGGGEQQLVIVAGGRRGEPRLAAVAERGEKGVGERDERRGRSRRAHAARLGHAARRRSAGRPTRPSSPRPAAPAARPPRAAGAGCGSARSERRRPRSRPLQRRAGPAPASPIVPLTQSWSPGRAPAARRAPAPSASPIAVRPSGAARRRRATVSPPSRGRPKAPSARAEPVDEGRGPSPSSPSV